MRLRVMAVPLVLSIGLGACTSPAAVSPPGTPHNGSPPTTTTTAVDNNEGTSASTVANPAGCVRTTVLVTATDPRASQSVCLVVGGHLIVTLPGKSSAGSGPWQSAPESLNTSVVEPTSTTDTSGVYVAHFTALGVGATSIRATYSPCGAVTTGSTGCSLPLVIFQILVTVTD